MKLSLSLLAFMTIALSLTACPKEPVPPTPGTDAGPEPDTPDASLLTCADWCKHAEELHCAAAKDTPAGAHCVDVCTNFQSGPAPFDLRCRVGAKTCTAADNCENKK